MYKCFKQTYFFNLSGNFGSYIFPAHGENEKNIAMRISNLADTFAKFILKFFIIFTSLIIIILA